MGLLSFEAKPEQPSAENVDVPTEEKSTDEQAPTKEAVVAPSNLAKDKFERNVPH